MHIFVQLYSCTILRQVSAAVTTIIIRKDNITDQKYRCQKVSTLLCTHRYVSRPSSRQSRFCHTSHVRIRIVGGDWRK
jgi:hypothetical protein